MFPSNFFYIDLVDFSNMVFWYWGGNGTGFFGKQGSEQEKTEATPEIKNYDIELTQDNEIIFREETLESIETLIDQLKTEVGEDKLDTIIVTIHDENAIADFLTSVEQAMDSAKIKWTIDDKN